MWLCFWSSATARLAARGCVMLLFTGDVGSRRLRAGKAALVRCTCYALETDKAVAAARRKHQKQPQLSSSLSSSSLGSRSGNQPYTEKSTVRSPSEPRPTATPSAARAASCRAAPFVPLCARHQHVPLRWTVSPSYRTLMTPLELMTRCQGTVSLLCRALGWSAASGRYLRQMPTWLRQSLERSLGSHRSSSALTEVSQLCRWRVSYL